MYESKVIDTQGQYLVTFDVPLTPAMAPTAHMMAYYVRPDMEIVADSIAFNIEGIFENEVSTMHMNRLAKPSLIQTSKQAIMSNKQYSRQKQQQQQQQ